MPTTDTGQSAPTEEGTFDNGTIPVPANGSSTDNETLSTPATHSSSTSDPEEDPLDNRTVPVPATNYSQTAPTQEGTLPFPATGALQDTSGCPERKCASKIMVKVHL